MDFFQAQDFFNQMYPGKEIKYEFDEKCHRVHELIYTDGKPNQYHQVENNKVKVTVEGQEAVYVSIMPHRETFSWDAIKNVINSKTEVFIQEQS